MLAIGVTAGFVVDPGSLWSAFSGKKAPKAYEGVEQVTEANRQGIISRENQLIVINRHMDGNPNSEALAQLMEKIDQEKPYGGQVGVAQENITPQGPDKAANEKTLEEYRGQLDFYAAGEKLGSLKGVTDPVVVDERIKQYLAGLVKRFGPGWMPEVEGMKQVKVEPRANVPVPQGGAPKPLASQPAKAPSGLPPGMIRVEPGKVGATGGKSASAAPQPLDTTRK